MLGSGLNPNQSRPVPKKNPKAIMNHRYTICCQNFVLETSLASSVVDANPEPVATLAATGLSVDFVTLPESDLCWEAVAEVSEVSSDLPRAVLFGDEPDATLPGRTQIGRCLDVRGSPALGYQRGDFDHELDFHDFVLDSFGYFAHGIFLEGFGMRT